MKISHFDADFRIAEIWKENYQKTGNFTLATMETCFQTNRDHKIVLENVSRHLKEKTIILKE